jgi:UDP-glucose 4-epimerase
MEALPNYSLQNPLLKITHHPYVLVTGGLGFIGSHVVIKLYAKALNIIILDNLSNSNVIVLDKIRDIISKNITSKDSKSESTITFVKGDIRNSDILDNIFKKYPIAFVLHFAALKSVNESQKYPELYEQINVEGTKNLLFAMAKNGCKKIIYSSSATVYGDEVAPVNENTNVGNGLACNYARNKYDVERYLIENSNGSGKFSDWKIVILRYFNPIGAHPSGKIGEDPNDIPNNVFPYLLRVAKWTNTDHSKTLFTASKSPYEIFTVFGDDYQTRDGTCIRDYVHVQDLARAHVDVLSVLNTNKFETLESAGVLKIYNVGTGKGSTVLELVNAMNQILVSSGKKPIPYCIGARREGDLDISYADVTKIAGEIGFNTECDINKMCKNGLNFVGL